MAFDKRVLSLTLVLIFSVGVYAGKFVKPPVDIKDGKFGSCLGGINFLLESKIDPKLVNVNFYLSSREKPKLTEVKMENILAPNFKLRDVGFKIERRTVMIVHGFKAGGLNNWVQRMVLAFRLWGDVNIVVVDWSKHAKTLNYVHAAQHVLPVGHKMADFLSHIVMRKARKDFKTLTWGPIHLVGHSLGAHICGVAANEVKRRNLPWRVGRITGLDPARPCFEESSLALTKKDAAFVDIIHTHGKDATKFSFGLETPIGHVDFYPNGGKKQPFCSKKAMPWYAKLFSLKKWIKNKTCSHGISHAYFTESLVAAAYKKGKFCAHKWDRTPQKALEIIHTPQKEHCLEMGINAEKYRNRINQGPFYVITSDSEPYNDVRREDLIDLEKQISREVAIKTKIVQSV